MPPTLHSRFLFTTFLPDKRSRLFLTARKPFSYKAFPDNAQHVIVDGDSLFTLAGQYLNDCNLWWVIADFQPTPILDPTIALTRGSVLFIPSVRTLNEEVFNELRRSERSA